MKYINEELLDRYLDKFVYGNIENNTANDSSYLISEDKGVKSFLDPNYFVLRTKQKDEGPFKGRYKLPDMDQYYFKDSEGKYYSIDDDGRPVYNVEKRPNRYTYSSIYTERALFDIMEKCENYAGKWAFHHNIDCLLKPDGKTPEEELRKCFWGEYALKTSYYDNYHLFYITGLFSFPLLSCLRVSNHQVNHVRWWETHSMTSMHTDCCLDIIINEEVIEPFNPSPKSTTCEDIDKKTNCPYDKVTKTYDKSQLKNWTTAVVVSIDIRYRCKNQEPEQNKAVDNFIANIIGSGVNRPTFKIDDIINIFSPVADISFIMSYDGVGYRYDCNSRQWTSIVENYNFKKDKDGDYSNATLEDSQKRWIKKGLGRPLNQDQAPQMDPFSEAPVFSRILPEDNSIEVPYFKNGLWLEGPIDKVFQERVQYLSERPGVTEIRNLIKITKFSQITVDYTLKEQERRRMNNLKQVQYPLTDAQVEENNRRESFKKLEAYPDAVFLDKYRSLDTPIKSSKKGGGKGILMQLKNNVNDENNGLVQFIAVDFSNPYYDADSERFYFKSYPVLIDKQYNAKTKQENFNYNLIEKKKEDECSKEFIKCFITLRTDYYREPSVDEFWENRIQCKYIGGYTKEDVYAVYMPKENAPYYVKDIGPILAVEDETGNDFLYFPAKSPNQKCIFVDKKELYEITFKDIVNMVNECLKKLL